jgi:hypothetical protein
MAIKKNSYMTYYQLPGPLMTFIERKDLTVAGLCKTHVFLRRVSAASLEDVFRFMQGDIWSPQGEARPLIEKKGLRHTSMSINDVVRDPDGKYWQCLDLGWRQLPAEVQHG